MSISTLLIRSVGVAGTALTLREINNYSQRNAAYKTRDNIANNLSGLLLKSTVNTDGSQFTNRLQKDYLQWRMDDNTIPQIQYGYNRLHGLKEATFKYAIPLGLSIAALLVKSKSKLRLYKGVIPKQVAGICAAGLGLIAATSFTRNVLGMGSNHPKGFYP